MNHDDEILTDNTKIVVCQQCRDCAFWGGGDLYSNRPDKSSCAKYPFPVYKPIAIMYDRQKCPYKEGR